MIPILYEANETEFTSNGIGRLTDCISCVVTEERNGIYECQFEYPVTGNRFSSIIEGRIICCTHDNNGDPQPFDIYSHSAPMDGVVTFYAHHISYRQSEITVKPFSASSCAQAIQGLKNNSLSQNPFTYWTDKAVTADFEITKPVGLKSMLSGTEGSLLDVYGTGEYEFDKWNVKLHLHRGSDTAVEIRYGKNLADLQEELDYSDCYTAVVPFWSNTDSQTGEDILVHLDEWVLDSGQVTYGNRTVVVPLDLSSEWQEEPTKAELESRARTLLNDSKAWMPRNTVDFDFVQLWQTEEYKDYAPLQRVNLCDTISLYYPDMGIVLTNEKIIRVEYDVLLERYNKMTVGSASTNFGDLISAESAKQIASATASIKKIIANTNYALQQEIDDAVDNATAQITGGLGGYVVLKQNANGKPEEILIMDNEDISQAVKVWRWNKNGLGYSSTGYNGTYALAMTQDGAIVADFITSGTMTANLIKAGILSDVSGYNYWNLQTGEFSLQAYPTSERVTEIVTESQTEAYNQAKAYTDAVAEGIQEQLDGVVDTYYYSYKPTLANEPASEWDTDAKKEEHIGDLFYDTSTGKVYRWVSDNTELIPYPYYQSTRTVNGITFTDNGDRTITANGTATATTNQHVVQSSIYELSEGIYKLTGCPSGGNASTYLIYVQRRPKDGSSASLAGRDTGSGSTFAAYEDSTYGIMCRIQSGKTVSNIVFNPKLVLKYGWIEIPDTDTQQAMQMASEALDVADHKRRVFVATPVPPYDTGDLWAQGENGDILRCATPKTSAETYSADDWVLASKYTDDTAINNLVIGGRNLVLTSGRVRTGTLDGGTNQNIGGSNDWKFTDYYHASKVGGADFVLSFDWETTATSGSIYPQLNGTPWGVGLWGEDAGIDGKYAIQVSAENQSGHYSAKSILQASMIPSTATYTGLRLRFDNLTGDVTIKNVKFEWGGKETSWTEAPEDVANEISALAYDLEGQLDGKIETWYQSSDPASDWTADEKTKHEGDLWYKTTDSTTWRWDGSEWKEQTVSDEIFDSIDGKSAIFYGTTSGTYENVQTGDYLVDNTDGSTYRYNGSSWTKVTDYASAVSSLRNSLETQIDSKVQTWYQSANPATSWSTTELKEAHVGDLWFYTGSTTATYTQNATYRYSTSYQWVECSVSSAVFDQIDGKSSIYYGKPSDSFPDAVQGDYLIDSTDGSTYRYTGSAWVKVTDYTSAIAALEIGGRNLLKKSDTAYSSAEYLLATYYLGDTIGAGETVTVQIKGTLASGKTGFALYNSGAYVGLTTLTSSDYDSSSKTYRKTFKWVVKSGDNTASNTYVRVYATPSSASGTSKITWIKLERGSKATDWTLAPEDVDSAINDLDASYNQQKVFNRLTNNGQTQGIYLQDGKVYINATYIHGGTLKLGGASNGNGLLEVYNASNSLVARLNNAGLYAIAGTVGGWTIASTYLKSRSGGYTTGLQTPSSGSYGIAVGATNDADWSTAPFRVTHAGVLTAENGYLNGGTVDVYNNDKSNRVRIASGGMYMAEKVSDAYTNYVQFNYLDQGLSLRTRRNIQFRPNVFSVFTHYADSDTMHSAFRVAIAESFACYLYGKTYVGDSMEVHGSLSVTGTKPRLVTTKDYGQRYLYCYETPSPMFGDVGEGNIGEDGQCFVWLDPIFAETISTDQYQVFLQRYGEGDCYVSERHPNYFVVSGSEGLSFGWELKSKQSDFDQYRLEKKLDTDVIVKDDYAGMAQKYINELKEGRLTNEDSN